MRLRTTLALIVSLAFTTWLAAQSDRADAQRNPLAGQPGAVDAGKKLYDATCQSCHGPSGGGGRGPALANGQFRHGSADGEVFLSIRSGINGTAMPPFAQFSSDQIWQLVSYLRSIAPPPVTILAAPATAETVPGDIEAGRIVFEVKGGCLACHTVNGRGTPVGPDLSFAATSTAQHLLSVIQNPGQGATVTATARDGKFYRGTLQSQDSFSVRIVDTTGAFRSFERTRMVNLKVENKSLMPADYNTRLSAPDQQNLIAYLKSLNGPPPLTPETGGLLTWDRIRNATKEPRNWLMYWGNLAGTHYSSLAQINTLNVKNLQAQWSLPLPGDGIVEAVPLVVDGIMYTMGPVGGSASVFALDAKTGRQLWRYDRKQKVTSKYEANRVSRGVTILGNRLFFGTLDAALVALDVRTGKPLWEIQIGDTLVGNSITSPPLVVKDKIIVGMSGGEYGIQGYVDAYEPATGKRLWRFNAIPGKGEFGNETWAGDSWLHGAGGMWLTGSYDPELNTIYWTVGNPGPDINGEVRKGDNLFSCSVVALDADTGKRKWHYQFTPHDTHDWDATEDLILVDRMWHGENRKLILQANRNGAFYVLDRTNGKFLAATPFVRATWVKGWDANGKPILVPGSEATPEGIAVYPSLLGGENFQAPSYSPLTGWFYTPYHDEVGLFSIGPAPYEPGRQFQGTGSQVAAPPPGAKPDTSGMMAIDPETGKVMWKFETPHLELSPGLLATGGSVVFAATSEKNFIALEARTGKLLWRFNAGQNFTSSPISYSVDGRQYVAISAANALYSFALPE